MPDREMSVSELESCLVDSGFPAEDMLSAVKAGSVFFGRISTSTLSAAHASAARLLYLIIKPQWFPYQITLSKLGSQEITSS